MARKLEAEIDLKTAQAVQRSKKFKQATREAKGQMKELGDEGDKTFGGIASKAVKSAVGIAGVSMGVGGILGTMRQIYQIMLQVEASTARMAQAEIQRMMGAAAQLGAPLLAEVEDVTGWTRLQAQRRALAGGARFDVEPAQYLEAVKRVWSRVAAPQREPALEAAMTFGRARGIPGAVGGGLTALLQEQYGAKGMPDVRRGLAQIGAAAEKSAYTAGEFGGMLSAIAAPMRAAGITTLPQQLPWVSAASLMFPDRPERAQTLLMQLSTLAFRKTPFMENLMRRAGRDPKSRNLGDILAGITQYIQAGGDLQVLQKETAMPFEVLRALPFTAGPAWAGKMAETRELVGGAQWGDVEARFGRAVQQPGARLRRAATGAGLAQFEFGAPGGLLEAEQLRKIMTLGVAARPGYAAGLAGFRHEMGQKMEPLSEAEAEQVYRLNAVWGQIRPQLVALETPRPQTSPISWRAYNLRHQGDQAAYDANRWHGWGSEQRQHIAPFENVVQQAIQFLRQVTLGQEVEIPSLRAGPGGGIRRAMPTPAQSGTADFQGAYWGGAPAPAPGGGNTTIINATNYYPVGQRNLAENQVERIPAE